MMLLVQQRVETIIITTCNLHMFFLLSSLMWCCFSCSFSACQRSSNNEGAKRYTNSRTKNSSWTEWWNSTAWLWKEGQFLLWPLSLSCQSYIILETESELKENTEGYLQMLKVAVKCNNLNILTAICRACLRML